MRSWFQKQPHLNQHLNKRAANWKFLGFLEVQFICFVLALAAASRNLDTKTLDLPAISGSINNLLISMTDSNNQAPPAAAAPAQPVFLLQPAEKHALRGDPSSSIQTGKSSLSGCVQECGNPTLPNTRPKRRSNYEQSRLHKRLHYPTASRMEHSSNSVQRHNL